MQDYCHFDDPDSPTYCRHCMDDLSSDALPLTDWHGAQPKSYCRLCWHDKTSELVCPEQDAFSYLEDRYLDWRG